MDAAFLLCPTEPVATFQAVSHRFDGRAPAKKAFTATVYPAALTTDKHLRALVRRLGSTVTFVHIHC